ncbi:MAG: hypothetical protein INH41_13355 [Myxococcaceae bacterium]|jgi:hypothetical protein|nr:hypothetical protein [Myxococcaceae bacterium]MCA3013368.1 hypothetical protein [Myxococcaceae bacterium]
MRPLTWLYGLDVALLATHQADAAYWREWDVFGVPGGVSFFLAFNLAAMALLLAGFALVAGAHPRARAAAYACAATGLVTCAIHGVFLHLDRHAFWSAPSLFVLGGVAACSVALAAQARGRQPPSVG